MTQGRLRAISKLIPVLASLIVFAPFQAHAAGPAVPPGQPLFSSSCAGCHGLDGHGGEHAPNIATNAKIQNLPDPELRRIVHSGIPSSGMPGFGARFNDTQLNNIVAYVRILQGKGTAKVLTGNLENGQTLFFGKAQCSSCHVSEGRGGFIASDLTGYGSSHPADEVKAAIVSPDRNLSPRQHMVVVVTRDGKKLSGVARNEDNFSLQLQTPDGAFHLFERSELQQVDHLPRSLMPSDYGSTLTPAELDDLVRYLSESH